MTMSRQDFELIARILNRSLQCARPSSAAAATMQTVAHNFANELAATNPRFDRARFLKASGVQS
jgi:histone H3/H4